MATKSGALPFTIDSALLRELGQRLVGKPYIALAELVKNSYDADATRAAIELVPEEDRIVVSDNGHGMDFGEFESFWMRIGSTHKLEQGISRNFGRTMTGSKGIGRLAVQYLARDLQLFTTSEKDLRSRLEAQVNWDEAVKEKDLTKVTVQYKTVRSDSNFEKGTKIVMTKLNQTWEVESIKGLARELWWLQPPFRSALTAVEDPRKVFEISFASSEEDFVKTFNWQMHAILDIWNAKLVGKNNKGDVLMSLEFAGEEPIKWRYPIPDNNLNEGNFEIRIYHFLKYKQPRGIKVGDARDYLNTYGGVHVYDGGFHLPYYGDPKNDWLGIEIAHSHRLSVSQLLPQELQVSGGMTYLPTLSRILGVVNVDTKEEDLKILITRDRLQETKAFDNLRYMIRYALDFYAMEMTRRVLQESRRTEKPKVERVEDVLAAYKPEIPVRTFRKLQNDLQKVTEEIETEAEKTTKQLSLISPLATAGLSSLAYQHEVRRQFSTVEDIVKGMQELEELIQNPEFRKSLVELREALTSWVERARATNALFAYFADPDNIRIRKRFLARKVIGEIRQQVQVLARGIPIDISRLDENLLLPEASLAEWGSIFQNVFTNAFNAMLDSVRKEIMVSSRIKGAKREILVQDTGSGMNLKDAQTLFEPFERRTKISPERQALGYGGMGLGLAIVRLIAFNIGCEVSFVEPEKGYSTAFSLKWRESK